MKRTLKARKATLFILKSSSKSTSKSSSESRPKSPGTNSRGKNNNRFRQMLLLVGATGTSCLIPGFASEQVHAQQAVNKETAVQEADFGKDLPRLPPTEADQTLSDFVIQPGYHLELAASEPLVRDPVAMSFDEQGRMFVVEMCDYSEQDKDFLGTIKLLTDTDGDGTFDTSSIYIDKLSWPTGIICFDGGVFVAAAPDIWYFKDADGDGIPEIRTKVYTGFGRSNVQGLLNSFCWGIDNRIYCQLSSSGAQISRPDKPEVAPVNANGRDFSFDPRTLDFRLESGGGQHGMSFDDWGRRFTCSNSDHLQLFLYSDRYNVSGAPFPLPPSRRSIASDGPQANVFRISPVEPWRIIRTRLRVTNQTPGMIEGGGRAAGYFTSATGVTIYRGDKFPDDMYGTAIVGDVGSNIIHRKKLTEQSISLVGDRIDQDSEFVASKDIWFRPVQFSNAPDGNLYIADLYREVIEHPMSLPPIIKKHLDLTSGRDRGRIYRLVADGASKASPIDLAKLSDSELVQTLHHRNGWHRDTASRLLYEIWTNPNTNTDRKEQIVQLIQKAASLQQVPQEQSANKHLNGDSLAQGRLHALGLLATCSDVKSLANTFAQALSDPHPRVREWGIQWSEPLFQSESSIQNALRVLANDPDARVRFQLALSLGASPLNTELKSTIAYDILKHSSNDPYIRAACFNAIGPQAFAILHRELSTSITADEIGRLSPIALLAGQLSSADELKTIDSLLANDKLLGSNTDKNSTLQLIQIQILDALQNRFPKKEELEAFLTKLENLKATRATLVQSSRDILTSDNASHDERLDALKIFAWDAVEADVPLLVSLFQQQDATPLQAAAAQTLRRMSTNQVASQLLDKWTVMTPRSRSQVLDIVFSRAAWTDVLLDVAEAGKFNLVDLDVVRLNSLRNGARTKERANRLVAESKIGSREEVYESYRDSLTLDGDRERGRQVFAKACAACHKAEGVGFEIGPNLASFQFRGADAILQNIIEPNREVNPQYVSYTVLTHDDRIITGMITNESASSVTLMRGENQSDTIERSDIAEMKSSRLSLMPEGLEQQIDVQSMADLLKYLTTLP